MYMYVPARALAIKVLAHLGVDGGRAVGLLRVPAAGEPEARAPRRGVREIETRRAVTRGRDPSLDRGRDPRKHVAPFSTAKRHGRNAREDVAPSLDRERVNGRAARAPAALPSGMRSRSSSR